MTVWGVLAGGIIVAVLAIGLGLIASITAAKRRNDAVIDEREAELLRHARRAVNVEHLAGELTEPFRPLVGAHSPQQPGRRAAVLAAVRREQERRARDGRHRRGRRED